MRILILINSGVSIRSIDIDEISSNEVSIKEKDNLIYLNDGKENISLLGVKVEEKYQANTESKNILFEFSQISEKDVRENSKNSKLTTYSSINNSRIISSGMIDLAFKLIQNYFECSNLINEINLKEIEIELDLDYLNNYAGFEITKENKYQKAIEALEILGFKFNKNNVKVPLVRHDIKNMQNIVEDLFRFYGLNNFEPKQTETKTLIIDPIDPIEKIISSMGYKQAWTYTLINKNKNDFNPFNFNETLNLKTFVSEEYNSIRNSIAIPMMNIFEYNIKRKMEKLSLFDTGMINNKRAIMIASNEKTFAQIKSDIEKISNQKFQIMELENDYFHPYYNAGLYIGGKLVGWIGKFNPFKYDIDVIFAEVLEEVIYKPMNKFIEFNQEALKERDITFEIKQSFENKIYLDKLNSIKGVFKIELISTYKKENSTNITYRILMNDEALKIFESIDWANKEKLMDF